MNPQSEPTPSSISVDPEHEPETPETITDTPVTRWLTRSCYSCNRKKIRCDKRQPCSACVRNETPCAYPASGPRIRRTKKTIISDMASRIAMLEKSLANSRGPAGSGTESQHAPDSVDIVPPMSTDGAILKPREDIAVESGSSSLYFNEVLLSRVIGRERHVQPSLTDSRPALSCPSESPFSALGLLSLPSSLHTPVGFCPSKAIAVRLWNKYIDHVESCAGLKLLHLPTDEIKIYSTIDNPREAPFENLALCFAIYYSATVAIDDAESRLIFGENRQAYLFSFKNGLEQTFAHGDFLDRPTYTGLQALAIYLTALRVHNRGKGMWILNGLAIRIAQSLGLHRDGEQLGLSHFQSELRRRLWWHFYCRDSRAGEDYGLEITTSLALTSDASLPLNVDDNDLYPEMEHLPRARKGWTAMTSSLVNVDLAQASQKLAMAAKSPSPSSPPNESTRAVIVSETREKIEKRLEGCNPVMPQHRMTVSCSRFLFRKFDFITRQQWLLLRNPRAHNEFVTEENLIEALEILEARLEREEEILDQFSWVRKAYPQYHVSLYILWHLCVKPEGPNVDRAWKAIENVFTTQLWDEFTEGFASKAAVLKALRAKALSLRNTSQNGATQKSCNDHFGVVHPSTEDLSQAEMGAGSGLTMINEDWLDIDISGNGQPIWAELARTFWPDGQDLLDDSW